MGILTSFKVNKAVNSLITATSADSAEVLVASSKLKAVGPSAVPALIRALDEALVSEPITGLLQQLLNEQSLPLYIEGLQNGSQKSAELVKNILATSDKYNANILLARLSEPNTPQDLIAQIIKARVQTKQTTLDYKKLVDILDLASASTRAILFQIIQLIHEPKIVPYLIDQSQSDDTGIRSRMALFLGGFDLDTTRNALKLLLEDTNSAVRKNALKSLAQMESIQSAREIAKMLKDPDLMVQSQAVDTLVQISASDKIECLIEILQDDSEYVRRAAVEVLNEVSDESAIKDLLQALKDKDWWVKVRAADALGSIGGEKVVDSVLTLVNDKDEFLRRTAIEILNNSQDKRAIDHLINALEDDDWWVRERAADALAKLKDERALLPLCTQLGKNRKSDTIIANAIKNISGKDSLTDIISDLPMENEVLRNQLLRSISSHENNLEQLAQHDSETGVLSQTIAPSSKQLEETLPNHLATSKENDDFVSANTPTFHWNRFPPVKQEQQSPAAVDSSGTVDANLLRPGMILAERYRIVRQVGRGGFGIVLLVDDLIVEEQLILKFLDHQFLSDQEAIARFTHELRYARRITHENIIRIYDFITFGRSYAISMEFFQSTSLSEKLKQTPQFDLALGIDYLKQICAGMAVAQSAGVVHRDLKPANILINDSGKVKIVDFGLAAAATQTDNRITRTGILVGTPTYMAPEQARGGIIDARTDIYSLGIIMYGMFTGHPPYKGEDAMATLFQHVEGKAKPIREINPSLPTGLESIVSKAMHVDPEQRFQSFAELYSALESVVSEVKQCLG